MLRRYDIIKTCQWNFFKFSWIVHYRKICKNQVWKRGHHAIFWALDVKTSKISPKLNKRDCFCLRFCFHFLWSFAQKLIYTNIWFNFVFGLFFEQDHPLNLFVLGVYAKRWPECARISIQKLMLPKIWLMNFFLTLTVRGPFHGMDFKWKKIWGCEFTFWKKRKFCMQNFMKEQMQPPAVIL